MSEMRLVDVSQISGDAKRYNISIKHAMNTWSTWGTNILAFIRAQYEVFILERFPRAEFELVRLYNRAVNCKIQRWLLSRLPQNGLLAALTTTNQCALRKAKPSSRIGALTNSEAFGDDDADVDANEDTDVWLCLRLISISILQGPSFPVFLFNTRGKYSGFRMRWTEAFFITFSRFASKPWMTAGLTLKPVRDPRMHGKWFLWNESRKRRA